MLVDGPLRKRDRPKRAWMEIVRINKKKKENSSIIGTRL